MPIYCLFNSFAATQVVPLPLNGSNIISFSLLELIIKFFIIFIGLIVGCLNLSLSLLLAVVI